MNIKKTFLRSTDALRSSWYQACVLSSLYITALLIVVFARYRHNYFRTAQVMVPECITMKETGNRWTGRERERERERESEITQFLVLPVLMAAFLHALASGLGFATGSQIPAHKT
jgi:hypothetical protein